MADFPPPPVVINVFHYDEVLGYIAQGVYVGQADRNILITNQNDQQQQLSQFLAALNAITSALSSSSAQLSQNIAALGSATSARFDSLDAAVENLTTTLTAQIAMFDTAVSNLLSLLQVLINAFQGAATLDAQNQMLARLQELLNFTSPERPKTIGLDLTHVTTTPQPTPAKQGPV